MESRSKVEEDRQVANIEAHLRQMVENVEARFAELIPQFRALLVSAGQYSPRFGTKVQVNRLQPTDIHDFLITIPCKTSQAVQGTVRLYLCEDVDWNKQLSLAIVNMPSINYGQSMIPAVGPGVYHFELTVPLIGGNIEKAGLTLNCPDTPFIGQAKIKIEKNGYVIAGVVAGIGLKTSGYAGMLGWPGPQSADKPLEYQCPFCHNPAKISKTDAKALIDAPGPFKIQCKNECNAGHVSCKKIINDRLYPAWAKSNL